MGDFNVSFGLKVDIAALQTLIDGSHIGDIGDALFIEGESLIRWSQDEWVPIVTGYLHDSAYVKPPVNSSNALVQVEVGYDAHYALAVHEAPPDWGQGLNKFLEWPLLLTRDGLLERVAQHLDQTLLRRVRRVGGV